MDRRHFLKVSAITTAGIVLTPAFKFAEGSSNRIYFVIDPDDSIANEQSSKWALRQLQAELRVKNIESLVVQSISAVPEGEKSIIAAGRGSKLAQSILKLKNVKVYMPPESLEIIEGQAENHTVLLASGNDSQGLVYSLLELADRVHYSALPFKDLEFPEPIVEQPANKVRSIYRSFASEVEDKPWFYDKEMWKKYLSMLAAQRFNRFQLAFGMGYNTPNHITDSYFLFAYPFLLKVPGYEVKMGNLPDTERDRNLEALKFISEEAALRGIQFQLGLWSHGIDWKNSPDPNYPLIGINSNNQAIYCRDALTLLLKECPSISGITFRVHGESGVPESDYEFWVTLFEAFNKCGRKIRIDMHAKNVKQKMIDIALATGMEITLSPKYWGEHQGVGYIPASIRDREIRKGNWKYVEELTGVGLGSRNFTRYSYGDYYREDRPYEILHRIWPGTQHLLLSGDPVLSSAYGKASSFCGSLGYDLLDPLTFKGRRGSGHKGGRCGYEDETLEPKYDWEKFLYTYRTYGRMAYNPKSSPDVWRRFLRVEFTGAEEFVEKSMSGASQILPLITTVHGPSADCSVYWPEIYTNMSIVNVEEKQPYKDTDDPKVFGNVSSFDPQFFSSINEFADSLLDDKTLQKYSPVEAAERLEYLSMASIENLRKAEGSIKKKNSVSFKRLSYDVKIQAELGNFFALKIRSAMLWRIFENTGDKDALKKAISKYENAGGAWKKIAAAANGVYVKDISFGDRNVLRGDWADRLGAINRDIIEMQKSLTQTKPDNKVQADKEKIDKAVKAILAHPERKFEVCEHIPIISFKGGEEIKVKISVPTGAKNVNLYYRHVNQGVYWQMQTMQSEGKNFLGTIPTDYTRTKFPLQYYFGIDTEKGPVIFPGLDENFMNQPYYVVRLER